MTTTILNLPEEVLLLTFKELCLSTISRCQYVCKAWYPTAHKLVLKRIAIPFTDIPKFIAAIDSNSASAYLNAVQGIYIQNRDNDTQQCHSFDKEMIAKMFYRFPNLKVVSLEDSLIAYDNFDDEICNTILKNCPKLEKFQIAKNLHVGVNQQEQDKYVETILKLRLLLTNINLEYIDFSTQLENSVDFLSKFPRLQTISNVPDLNNFRQLLPIFAHLKNLKEIDLRDAMGDQEGFVQTYLASKPKDEQKQIIKTLSAVKELNVVYKDAIINENTIEFIAKYLTGLHSLSISSYSMQNLQHVRLLNSIINLVCATVDRGFSFSYVRKDDFKTCLPTIISNLYTSMEKVFRVDMKSGRSRARGLFGLLISSCKPTRNMNIKPSALRNITIISPETKTAKSLIVDVDECPQGYERKLTAYLYDSIYNTMPILQNVTLEASPWYTNDSSPFIAYPLIKRATLRVIHHSLTQAMLDRLTTKFPNLTELRLINVCKTWNHKQQLSLPGHSLEKLSLDLTPLRCKKNSYITIHVSLTSNNEEHLYKVTRSPEIIPGRLNLISEYGHVDITLNDLKRLDVYTRQDGKLSPLTLFDKTT